MSDSDPLEVDILGIRSEAEWLGGKTAWARGSQEVGRSIKSRATAARKVISDEADSTWLYRPRRRGAAMRSSGDWVEMRAAGRSVRDCAYATALRGR